MLSLQKAARVLGAFSTTTPEWGVRALAAELELPRATAHAYLAGLSDAGLLRRTPMGRYRLSWRLAEMGAQLNTSLPWFLDARQLITRLALETQSVAFLSLLEATSARLNRLACCGACNSRRSKPLGGSGYTLDLPIWRSLLSLWLL